MDLAAAPAAIRRDHRACTVAICVFAATAVGLMVSGDWGVLSWLGIDPLYLPWADARTITGAGVALERGLDPLHDNPGDPWGRALNYPRVWLLLPRLGMTAEHTWMLAWALLAAFFVGLMALRRTPSNRTGAVLLACGVLAPTTWLAVERANNDLLVFALVAVATTMRRTRWLLACVLIGVAGVLKLYPIAAIAALVDERRRRSLATLAVLGVAFVLYVAWLGDDIALMKKTAMHAPWLAYGIETLPTLLAKNTAVPRATAFALAAIVLLATATLALRNRTRGRLAQNNSPAAAAFRAGAAIYLGTFLLGTSFDYRLVFLLLTLPQLAHWWRAGTGPVRHLAAVAAIQVLLLQWSLLWRAGLEAAAGISSPGLLLDELLSWGVWMCLMLLLVATLPEWLLPSRWRGAPQLDIAHAPLPALPAPSRWPAPAPTATPTAPAAPAARATDSLRA